MAADSPHVVSTTDPTFELDVIARSHEVPVIVDFWASWCQPCMMLAPLLEKLADEYAGRFLLVKAETEHNQAAAGEFNVSSIPAVYGVLGGEVVDYFQGFQPEPQLRQWLDRIVAEAETRAVIQLEATDPAAAEAKYRELILKLPREAGLQIGLGRALVAQGRTEEAEAIVVELAKRGFLEPAAEKLKAAVDLAKMQGGDLTELTAQAEAEPQNLEVQLKLAEALAGAGRHEEALQRALAIVQQQKTGPGEQARQLMVDLFRVLPGDSELVGTYRRKLSSALF